MEKSAFSPRPSPPLSCPCPCPEALLRSSCGAFGLILYSQVPILLLDTVLNGAVYGTQGSALSSLVALVVFLMEMQSSLPDSFYCCVLYLQWCLACQGLLLASALLCSSAVTVWQLSSQSPKRSHSCVCLGDELRW